MKTNIDKIINDVSMSQLQESFRTDFKLQATNALQSIDYSHPRTFKWLYDQLNETSNDEIITSRHVINEFDQRISCTSYNYMLQLRNKKGKIPRL